MKRIFPILGVLLLGGTIFGYVMSNQPTPTTPDFNEMKIRQHIIDQVQQALERSDFTTLEELSRSFRENKSRTHSGIWKLSVFYDSFRIEKNEAAHVTREKLIDDWVQAYPKSPSAHIVKSKTLLYRAWFYRGNNIVKETPSDAWLPFYTYVNLALENHLKYKEIASIDPEWYAVTIQLAMVSNWKRTEFDNLIKEAIEREPYYYDIYLKAFEYLLPKWHGSFEEADQFARNMQNVTSKEDGRSLYARIYWNLNSTNINHLFRDDKFASWPEMKKSFDDMMIRYPDEWNLHNYAKLACLAGDKETAHQLIDKIWHQLFVYPQQFGKAPDLRMLQMAWDIEHTADLFTRCKTWAEDPNSTENNPPSEDML